MPVALSVGMCETLAKLNFAPRFRRNTTEEITSVVEPIVNHCLYGYLAGNSDIS